MDRVAPLIAAVTLVAFTSACTLPPEPPPPPTPPTRYYSAAAEMEQVETRDASGDEFSPLTADAGQIIHPGVKIAFFPPNQCETTPSEAGTGAAKEKDLIRMDCGALMSSLEARAAQAKYEVVSWQALKHRDKPPLEMARELKVDVLFEINELSVSQRQLGTSRATGLSFGQQTGPTDRIDVAVTPEVAQRCKAVFDPEIARATPVTLEAVLDAKGVEVKTGRALVYYRRAKPEGSSAEEHRGITLFYPTPGMVDWEPPERSYNAMQKGGGYVTALASGTTFAGLLLLAVDKPELVTEGGVLIGVGLASLIGGLVMMTIGNKRQAKMAAKVKYPPPVYEPSEKIICVGLAAVPPWQAPGTEPAQSQQPTTSTSYSFTEQTSSGKDNERARREKLVREAAVDFVARLDQLSKG